MTSYNKKGHLKNCHATKIYKNNIRNLVGRQTLS